MRRPLLGRISLPARRRRFRALLQSQEFGLQAIQLAGHVEHGLVLLDHVALQPRQALFETVNSFVRHGV